MFNLTKGTIEINGEVKSIDRFEVWFRTPFGLHHKLDDAIKKCTENDLIAELMIAPIPVALTKDNCYEALLR